MAQSGSQAQASGLGTEKKAQKEPVQPILSHSNDVMALGSEMYQPSGKHFRMCVEVIFHDLGSSLAQKGQSDEHLHTA